MKKLLILLVCIVCVSCSKMYSYDELKKLSKGDVVYYKASCCTKEYSSRLVIANDTEKEILTLLDNDYEYSSADSDYVHFESGATISIEYDEMP